MKRSLRSTSQNYFSHLHTDSEWSAEAHKSICSVQFRNGNSAPVDAQFPIGGFQVNVFGPDNDSNATFTSGAGELAYSVPLGSSLSVQNGGVGRPAASSRALARA